MNKARYVPPTIEQEGLEAHVNKHAELGFKVFEQSILRGVNIANLRRLLDGKQYRTLKDWIRVYADTHPDSSAFLRKTYNLKGKSNAKS